MLDGLPGGTSIFGAEVGRERDGPYTGLKELRHLILHEGNQRRDDDTDPWPAEGRNLVADRLPATGRHEDERIPRGNHMIDDLRLQATKTRVAEHACQNLSRVRCGHGRTGTCLGHT